MPSHDYYSRQRERIALANRDIDRRNLEALRAVAREKEQEQKRMSVIGYSSDPQRDYLETLKAGVHARATNKPLPAHARDYEDLATFAGLAHACLMLTGRDAGLNPREQGAASINLALTTSDFGFVLNNLFAGVMLTAYRHARAAYRRLGARREFPNLQETRILAPGEFPRLKQVGEGGEVQAGSIEENGETGVLISYARRFTLSRQAMVNDAIGYFRDIAQAAAAAAVDLEDAAFFEVLTSGASGNGPTMRDGAQLFATARGNLAGSGGAISTTTISAGRAAMMGATSPNGMKGIAVPRFLLCPPALLTLAETELAKLNPGSDADMRITPIASPNLSGSSWYLVASPEERPAMVRAYLAGSPDPVVVAQPDWETEGISFRVTLDFAAVAADPAGAYKNPGS